MNNYMGRLGQTVFLVSFMLFSCGQSKQAEEPKKEDSVYQHYLDVIKSQSGDIKRNYRPLDTDTLVSEKEISLNNQSYSLKIIRYCLNDSAVVNQVWRNVNTAPNEFDISHNYSERISLTKGNDLIFYKEIFKDAFKDRMDTDDYLRKLLFDIQYNFEKANRLYFTATFVDPDTNRIEEIGFALLHSTEKTGQLDFSGVEPEWVTFGDELKIYDLRYYGKDINESVGFVSLSDTYPLSDHPDSLAIPDLYSFEDEYSFDNYEYFKLDSKYRKRFLVKTKISETDKVFLYNYHKDTLASFTVKDLKVVACLNVYRQGEEGPFSQFDYMFGFEIDKDLLKHLGNDYYATFIYVGKEDPFVRGQLKPVEWKKIETADFPPVAISTKTRLLLKGRSKGNAYTYRTADLEYFDQEYMNEGRISARRLLIVDAHTKEIARDVFYFSSEGSKPAPLNSADRREQWTGKLFRDRPPVIFGLEYVSFGCPYITCLNRSVRDVAIYCDNRH